MVQSGMVEFSSVLSGVSAGTVEFMIPLGILCDTTKELNEATTFWLLRYTTKTKPAFRFKYVHAYYQLTELPSKHFCDEILTCNDVCIYLIQNRVSTTC